MKQSIGMQLIFTAHVHDSEVDNFCHVVTASTNARARNLVVDLSKKKVQSRFMKYRLTPFILVFVGTVIFLLWESISLNDLSWSATLGLASVWFIFVYGVPVLLLDLLIQLGMSKNYKQIILLECFIIAIIMVCYYFA